MPVRSPAVRQPSDRPALLPVLAIAAAFALVIIAAAFGGPPAALVNLPSLLIVVGGTVAATAASFDQGELRDLPASLRRGLKGDPAARLEDALERGIALAHLAQRAGLLALEPRLADLDDLPLLQRGLGLAIDGNAARLQPVLEGGLEEAGQRSAVAVAILRRAAEVAPAAGLIGTLVGLVHMLGQLDRPEAIGAAMAVALLTTLYGALAAHLLLLPLAERMARTAASEARLHRLELDLACAIAARESPPRLRDRLETMHRQPRGTAAPRQPHAPALIKETDPCAS